MKPLNWFLIILGWLGLLAWWVWHLPANFILVPIGIFAINIIMMIVTWLDSVLD